jgi:hypothetical protein
MDAGNNGVIVRAGKMLPPRKHGVLIPGPQAQAMKLGSRSTRVPGRAADPGRDHLLIIAQVTGVSHVTDSVSPLICFRLHDLAL